MAHRIHLRTSDLARAAGIHPNTVRLYERWGFLPRAPRSPSGYRLYGRCHLDQLRLARQVIHGEWPGIRIRKAGIELVRMSAAGDLNRALELARQLVSLVQAERAQAEAAAAFLQHWAEDAPTDVNGCCLRISEAARLLDTTVDALYNWERNGLIDVPRNPGNGYRLYRPPEIGRLRVIRMLLRSGYSMMAILRMLLKIDQGQVRGLRQALDTPRPDEDAIYASDHWLTVLAEQEERARHTVAMLKEQFRKDQ